MKPLVSALCVLFSIGSLTSRAFGAECVFRTSTEIADDLSARIVWARETSDVAKLRELDDKHPCLPPILTGLADAQIRSGDRTGAKETLRRLINGTLAPERPNATPLEKEARRRWRAQIDGAKTTLANLEPARATTEPRPKLPLHPDEPPIPGWDAYRVTGVVLSGVAVLGAALATGLAIAASGDAVDAERTQSDSKAREEKESATNLANLSLYTFLGAGAVGATGITLIIVGNRSADVGGALQKYRSLGPDALLIGTSGTF